MANAILRFGRHQLDARRGELLADGKPVELPPLILRLLVYLAENRHRTVPVDELLDEVWQGVHVSETALHQAIRQARLAVDDDGRRQVVIRNFARRGYRFVAPVDDGAAPMTPSTDPYVGREPLLALLDDAVSSAALGRSRVLLVSGEPGIGKTRTLDEIESRARSAGALVARGAGSPHAGAPPFWPWVQALRELATARPVQALLRDVESLEPPVRDDAGERDARDLRGAAEQFRLFDQVATALQRSAALGPVVILLDDLHDAGAAAFDLCAFLGRELAPTDAVLVAAAYRPAEARRSAARAAAIARAARLPNAIDVKLEGLSLAESRALIALHERQPLEPVLLDALVERARGNPFYLVELARELGGPERPRTRGDAGTRVARAAQELIVSRLAALPTDTRRWLRVASALGLRFERALVAALTPGADGEAASAEAVAQGVIVDAVSGDGGLAFSHALVRDAVYCEIPDEERRQLHLRIAEHIEQHHVVEAAFHFAEAAPLGGAERAVAFLRHAAQSARAHFDAETAGALYQRAIEIVDTCSPDDAATRCDLLIDFGRTVAAEGRLEAARDALESAARLARGHRWPERLAATALAISNATDYDAVAHEDLVERLGEALELVDESRSALRAQLLARTAVEVRYRPDGAQEAEQLLTEALALARGDDDVVARARVLEYATLVRWSAAAPESWVELSEELIETAREAEDPDLVFRGVLGLVTESMQLGDRPAMERESRRCVELAERYPAPYQRASRIIVDSARHFLDGDFEAAERGVRLSLIAEAPEALLPSFTQLYYLHLETGRVAQLEDQLLELHGREPHRDSWKLALARLYGEEGRLDEARRFLDTTTPADAMPRDRLWLPTVALMAEVVSLVGEKTAAVDLLGLLEPFAELAAVYGRGTLYYGSVSHFLGLLAGTIGDLGRAEAYLLRALRAHREMRAPPWEIRTGAELVRLGAEAGRPASGDVDAAPLRERASRMGMHALVERLDHLTP